MINTIEINEVQVVTKELSFKEFLHDHARFTLFDPIYNQWAEIYELPKGKRAVYIYYEYYDGNGECYEKDVGFLILHLEEYVTDRHLELKEFCLANMHRIIHANPDDR